MTISNRLTPLLAIIAIWASLPSLSPAGTKREICKKPTVLLTGVNRSLGLESGKKFVEGLTPRHHGGFWFYDDSKREWRLPDPSFPVLIAADTRGATGEPPSLIPHRQQSCLKTTGSPA